MALFHPDQLGSLLAYWAAVDDHGTSLMTDDGSGLISLFTDRKLAAACTGSGTARPTWSATSFPGSRPGLTFDATATNLTTTATTGMVLGTGPGEFWYVAKATAIATNAWAMSIGVGVAGTQLRSGIFATSGRFMITDGTTTGQYAPSSDQTAAAHVFRMRYTGAQGLSFVDGVASTAHPYTFASKNVDGTRFRLGAASGTTPTLFSPMVARHFIQIVGSPTAVQAAQLDGWLAWDSGITPPVGHPYRDAAPTVVSVIDVSGQTRFGDMTLLGGLAAAFNGVTDTVAAGNAAAKSFNNTGNGYVGTRLAAAKRISKVAVYGANDTGYLPSNVSVTVSIYGKSGSDPANSTDGTLLSTLTFTDTTNEAPGRVLNVTDTGTYDRVWARFNHADATARTTGPVELVFYEEVPDQTLVATLYVNPDSFGAADVSISAAGATDLTATLYADPDSFGTAVVARGVVTATATLYVDPDSFGTPGVTRGAVTLAPTLYVDPDSFGAASITGAGAINPAHFANVTSFGAAAVTAGPRDLTATAFTNTQSFGAATLTSVATVAPQLAVDPDSFGAFVVGRGAVTLTPILYVRVNSFGTPVVGRGPVELTAICAVNTASFGAAVVNVAGITVVASHFADPDSFGTPGVGRGPVVLTPTRLVDTDSFGSPVATSRRTLLAQLVDDPDSFGVATVEPGAVSLHPVRVINASSFGAAEIECGPVDVAPTLYTDADSFGVTHVQPGVITLQPTLYVDPDVIFPPELFGGNLLLRPHLYIDVDVFHTPLLTLDIQPTHFQNVSIFHATRVQRRRRPTEARPSYGAGPARPADVQTIMRPGDSASMARSNVQSIGRPADVQSPRLVR